MAKEISSHEDSGHNGDLPDAAALMADFRVLGTSAVRRLADISFRATWRVTKENDWARVLTTSVQRIIALPELPGVAMYIEPGVRRLCAAVEEGEQGLWDKTVVVGSRDLVGELRAQSLGFAEFYNSPQSDIVLKAEASSAFAMEYGNPGLQLVCFDGMDDATDTLVAQDIVRGAEQRLDTDGLLVLGGTLHNCIGRQSLADTISLALGILDLQHEEERPLNGGTALAFQVIFSK